MNDKYLEKAKERISDPKILAVVAAKRARQLARGAKRMVKTTDKEYLDIALLEIAEGLIDYKLPKKVD
jgi:DNA-directed RNA polymerase omega subunit